MFKKIMVIFGLFLIVGCQNNPEPKNMTVYNKILTQIKQMAHYDQDYPFTIKVQTYNKDTRFEYSVIIDDFKENLKKVTVLVYDKNIKETELYSSLGVFDEKVEAIPATASKINNHQTKGIILNQENSVKKIDLILFVGYELNGQYIEKVIEVKK